MPGYRDRGIWNYEASLLYLMLLGVDVFLSRVEVAWGRMATNARVE